MLVKNVTGLNIDLALFKISCDSFRRHGFLIYSTMLLLKLLIWSLWVLVFNICCEYSLTILKKVSILISYMISFDSTATLLMGSIKTTNCWSGTKSSVFHCNLKTLLLLLNLCLSLSLSLFMCVQLKMYCLFWTDGYTGFISSPWPWAEA